MPDHVGYLSGLGYKCLALSIARQRAGKRSRTCGGEAMPLGLVAEISGGGKPHFEARESGSPVAFQTEGLYME
jgi:hypothetical protein